MKMWYPVLFAMAACVHSDPLALDDQEVPGPFNGALPLRLTYSPLTDTEPGFSSDESWITYQYQRGTSDRDLCLGVMASQGGQRHWELCPWDVNQASSADGLTNAALRDDGMILFSMHSGLINNLAHLNGGVYLAPVDSIHGAVKLMTLPNRPAGATAVYQDMVDPVWVSGDEIMFLGARRFLVNMNCITTVPDSCAYDRDRTMGRDTVHLGIEVARMRVSPNGLAMLSIVPADEANAWSVDTSADILHLVIQRATAIDFDFYHESIADTVFVVPLTGGGRAPLYGVPQIGSDRVAERVHAVASGGGRVFISRSWRRPSQVGNLPFIPVGTELVSDISEILADGSLRKVADQISWRWGKLRLTADGRTLLAEAVDRTTTDLYQISVGP